MLAWFVKIRKKTFSSKLFAAAMAAAFAGMLFGCGDGRDFSGGGEGGATLGDARVDEYVGSASCAKCHQEEHDKWHGSHHFHAMELPTNKTVRGDFNGSTYERFGVVSRFFREGKCVRGSQDVGQWTSEDSRGR